MAKRKSLICLMALSTVLCVMLAVFGLKTPVNAETTDTGVSYTYSYDASKDWTEAEVNLPNELIKDGVADMSNIKAMVYEVDNSSQPKFLYTLGIFDKDHTTFNDQWHMDDTGSALFVPENGHPFWASTFGVPAGFKGTVVIPWSTTTYDWTNATKYNTFNNPVFKTRYSKNTQGTNKEYGKGYYYTDGSKGTFPTARMDTKMTFYVHNDWNTGTSNITFNNIRFVESYDSYLQQAATYDTESIGTQSNQITMENAIAFNKSGYMAPTYKLQSGGGTSVTSLDNNVGLAIRIKNMTSKALNLEVKINESSSETLFINYNNVIKFPFIHTDGRVEYIRAARYGMAIPENSDGTVIIPNLAWALSANPNKPADLNGRLNGNMWAIYFFAHDIGVEQTFAIAEINQIYASYNTSTSKTEYTLKPMKTATGGTDVSYVKNLKSWVGAVGALTSKAVAVTETTDGATSSNATLSAGKVYYKDSAVLTVPKVANTNVSATLNGQGIELTDNGENYTYTYANTENVAGEANFAVEYKTTYVVTYVDGNGQTQTLNSVDGKVTLPTLTNAEADVFVGYKVGDKIYKAGEIEVTEAMDLTPVFVDMDMIKGASIRFSNPTGIRFAATINNADIEALGSAVSMGMVITRTIGDEVKYLDAVANNTYAVDANTTGFNVVVSNISNFDAIYEAKAYVIVNYANGGLTRVLANANDNVRSVKQVAQAVLDAEGSKLPQNYLDILNGFIGA